LIAKPSFCTSCPLNQHTSGYVPVRYAQEGSGRTLVVTEPPNSDDINTGTPASGAMGSIFNNTLAKAGLKRPQLNVINVIGCRPWSDIYPLDPKWHFTSRVDAYAGVSYCVDHHLRPAIDKIQPTKIITMGDEALAAVTDRKGVMVWRGSPLPVKWDHSKLAVLPTLGPTALVKDWKMLSAVINDIRKPLVNPVENYNLYATPTDLAQFTSPIVSLDFEWDRDENITIAGISSKFHEAMVGDWSGSNLTEFQRILENCTDLIGHNLITAECRYLERLPWKLNCRMHDTMLKQHLCQPDMKHGLGFVASVFTNKMFWKGKGAEQEDETGLVEVKYQYKTWDKPEGLPRELGGYKGCKDEAEAFRLYNARDTEGTFQINTHLDHLLKLHKLEDLYWNVSLPIAYICRDISSTGIKIDNKKLPEIRKELDNEIYELEKLLPDGLRPYYVPITKQIPAPAGTVKSKTRICKGTKDTRHDPVTLTFHQQGQDLQCPSCGKLHKCPKLAEVKRVKIDADKLIRPWSSTPQVLKYVKEKGLKVYVNRKKGREAADVNARAAWGRVDPAFRIVDRIKLASTEYTTFAKEALEREERIYFRLNPTGTSEGRFSSSGQRDGIDPNIQNQPKSIRKIYLPDQEDYCFIELDYASAENMLTAWLARDWNRLERLRQPGYSEHLDLGMAMFNLPNLTKSDKDVFTVSWAEGKQTFHVESTGEKLYGTAKVVNHGGNYGMGFHKLQEELEANGFFYSAAKCKEFIAVRKALNPETARWQDETMEQAARDGYLRNPFGRVRWFTSRSAGTQALAFLPASTLADIIIRAMIAHYPSRFPKECMNLGLQVTGELEPGWRIAAQVHDSLLSCGPAEKALTQAHKSAMIMKQPWAELGGFSLDVEIKMGEPGGSWGSLRKVELE